MAKDNEAKELALKKLTSVPDPEEEEEEEESSSREATSEEDNGSDDSEEERGPSAPPVVASIPEPVKPLRKESSSASSDDESEEEQEPSSKPAPVVASDSDSHSESGSESKSEESKKLPPAACALPIVAASSSKKRRRKISEEAGTSKRVKTGGTFFQKLWSDDDEVILLQTIIDYKARKTIDTDDFYKIVQNSVAFEIKNVKQLDDKIRWLKKKYVGKKSFTQAHDLRCSKLAKRIWKSDTLKIDWFDRSFFPRALANMALDPDDDEESIKERWKVVPSKVKKEIEKGWKSLNAYEAKYMSVKTSLLNKVSSAIFE